MKTVLVSGYFDPLHSGHIKHINEAKKLGDRLIVVVNNDFQASLKKIKAFYNENMRFDIINNLKSVDKVYLSIDKGRDIGQTIRSISEIENIDVFAKSSDCTQVPEAEQSACDDCGIEIQYKIGDGIDIHSSDLILNEFRNTIWGRWRVLDEYSGYKVKLLEVNPHSQLSLQRHFKRYEFWTVVKGVATVMLSGEKSRLFETDGIHIKTEEWHQLINETDGVLRVIEVAFGNEITEEDIERSQV